MMHRCSSNMVGQCSCGLFHSQSNSFTMLFSYPNNNNNNQYHHKSYNAENDHLYSFNSSSSSSSSIDCTLSLGTPSTRLSEDDDKKSYRSTSNCMSNFCWDILQSKNTPYPPQNLKNSRASNNNSNNADPLLARRCANCDTTSTPLWRNGPRGPKSLCNACGIRYKKEERRATAANANSNGSNATTGMMEQQHYAYQNNSWVQTQKLPCFSPANEYVFMEDNDRDFLSWRLNVTDRPSLVHNFTR